MPNPDHLAQMKNGKGFIAALDQSGGSTPKALALYGIGPEAWATEAEMHDLIHAMRARVARAPAFTGDKVLGAILFEMTMDREIGGLPAPQFLWAERRVVPFLKIDKGLEAEVDGCQLMKPMPELDALLDRAAKAGVFGTKERSVISAANPDGIKAVIDQQFAVAKTVVRHGMMPIIEPEVTISIADKEAAETILLAEITRHLDALGDGDEVMLKLTLPSVTNLYAPLVAHPRVLRVVALSGGYERDLANAMLAENNGVIASFSRALTEGLSAQQSDAEFNAAIATAIDGIYAASIT